MFTTISELITEKELRKWKPKDNIHIQGGTGTGKTHFIMNDLVDYCRKFNRRILLVEPRTRLKQQAKKDTKTKSGHISIISYQEIETMILNGLDAAGYISKFSYLVADEYQYFLNDASMNVHTDLSLQAIMAFEGVRIFMSATDDSIITYLKGRFQLSFTREYIADKKQANIKNLFFYYNDDELNNVILDCLTYSGKTVLFVGSINKGVKLYRKFIRKGYRVLFNCSVTNQDNYRYVKYVDAKAMEKVITEQTFKDHDLLITTTALDTGFNLIDTDIGNIIIDDIRDVDTAIQCIGRKRTIGKHADYSVIVRDVANNVLSGHRTTMKKALKSADYLLENTAKALESRYYRRI